MYKMLSVQLVRLFIEELRRFWALDPTFTDLVGNIQGKFSFEQRPNYGIVVKSTGTNQVKYSADNFLGTIESYVFLMKVAEHPGVAIEFVRENSLAIQANGGYFPSAPGVYYIQVQKQAQNSPAYVKSPQFEFFVDPLLDVYAETPTKLDAFQWMLANTPVQDSVRVYEMPGCILLQPGINYTIDYTTGIINLTEAIPTRNFLSVDYRYAGEPRGPFPVTTNFANYDAIPGVVLGFGDRVGEDICAVVVSDRRQPASLEYGGKWEVSLSLDIWAQDVDSQQRISDNTLMYLQTMLNSRLSTRGIEIMSVSDSGGSEEPYDQTGDTNYYTSSVSMTVLADWAVYVPLDITFRRVIPQSPAQVEALAALPNAALAGLDPGALTSLTMYENMGLQIIQDPFFRVGDTFEMIR